MPTTLTPRNVAKLKASHKARDVWDAVVTGLGIRTFPVAKGKRQPRKVWSLRYRIARMQRRLTLGDLRVLSVADARKLAKAKLVQVANGVDPAEEKIARREADTVGEFADTYIEKHAKPKKKTWKTDQMRLDQEVLPYWKQRPMKEITRRDVRELLERIAARPAPIVANRVRSLLHKMFNIAIRHDVVAMGMNPVTHTEKPGKERQRDRVLSAEEIRVFWTACEALPAGMGSALKLMLITAQRHGETFNMRWKDVDLESGWWTIPKEFSKNGLPHRVPLSSTAVEILNAVKAHTDAQLKAQKHPKPSVFVHCGVRGKRQQAEAMATFTIPDFRAHDLRRTAASHMTGSGTQRLVVAKILNHAEGSVTAVYDRHSYDAEKRIALDAWARHLVALTEERAAGAVLPFARA